MPAHLYFKNLNRKALPKEFLLFFLSFFCCCLLSASHSTWTSPRTIDPSRFKFIVLGDTRKTSGWEFWRERNHEVPAKLFSEAARRSPAFVLHTGDFVVRGSSDSHWEFFDRSSKPLGDAKIPLLPVIGNHEYSGSNREALSNYFKRFPWLKRKTWYFLRWKEGLFLILNSNFDEISEEENANQLRFYRNMLKAASTDAGIKYVVVCAHHPPYTNSTVEGPSYEVQRLFVKDFLSFPKAGVFFSGHSHTYEHFLVKGKHFVVSGGGGAPRHKVNVDKRTRRYNDLFEGPEKRFFHFIEGDASSFPLTFRVFALDRKKQKFYQADSFKVP